jgi:putative membrane protein
LNVRRGFLLRIQQNIPLDKITDLALYEGPILRYVGLCSLRIETAGGGQASSTGQAMLPGVVDAEGFRDRVLAQRDAVVLDGAGTSMALREAGQATPSGTPAQTLGSEAVLVEIRDTLGRIEQRLGERAR